MFFRVGQERDNCRQVVGASEMPPHATRHAGWLLRGAAVWTLQYRLTFACRAFRPPWPVCQPTLMRDPQPGGVPTKPREYLRRSQSVPADSRQRHQDCASHPTLTRNSFSLGIVALAVKLSKGMPGEVRSQQARPVSYHRDTKTRTRRPDEVRSEKREARSQKLDVGSQK